VAVWVGFIALFGIAVDDGVIMATYINQTFRKNPARRFEDIRESIVGAGKRRIRPCLMTTVTTILALIPILLASGRGADVMKPMAIPSVGGMLIELVSLFGIPVSYCGLLQLRWKLGLRHPFFAVDPKDAEGLPRPGDPAGPDDSPPRPSPFDDRAGDGASLKPTVNEDGP
jgi:Cu(I)/Ag(I) efflux system membrane protein CusA/SilA